MFFPITQLTLWQLDRPDSIARSKNQTKNTKTHTSVNQQEPQTQVWSSKNHAQLADPPKKPCKANAWTTKMSSSKKRAHTDSNHPADMDERPANKQAKRDSAASMECATAADGIHNKAEDAMNLSEDVHTNQISYRTLWSAPTIEWSSDRVPVTVAQLKQAVAQSEKMALVVASGGGASSINESKDASSINESKDKDSKESVSNVRNGCLCPLAAKLRCQRVLESQVERDRLAKCSQKKTWVFCLHSFTHSIKDVDLNTKHCGYCHTVLSSACALCSATDKASALEKKTCDCLLIRGGCGCVFHSHCAAEFLKNGSVRCAACRYILVL